MNRFFFALSLLAASTLVSAQMTVEDIREKDAEVAASLAHFAKKKGATGKLDYQHAYFDLNNDNKLDAVALLKGPQWCTADGCTMAVLIADKIGFDFMGTTEGVNAPIRVNADVPSRFGYVPFVLTNKDGKNIILKFQQLSYPKSTADAPKASASDLSLAKILIDK
jgi:hypothetical protein